MVTLALVNKALKASTLIYIAALSTHYLPGLAEAVLQMLIYPTYHTPKTCNQITNSTTPTFNYSTALVNITALKSHLPPHLHSTLDNFPNGTILPVEIGPGEIPFMATDLCFGMMYFLVFMPAFVKKAGHPEDARFNRDE